MVVDINDVISIVKDASQVLVTTEVTVDYKGGCENIVTSADKAVQNFLCEKLSRLLPGSGFLGEEDYDTSLGHEYVWIVDPIDGTANFSRSIPECCISVALKHGRDIVLGVVYNPYRDDLFVAEKGRGASRNGRNIRVSSRPFTDGIFCTAMSLYKKKYAGTCSDIIMEVYMQSNDVRRFGSCALELCYLAAGVCDLYFEYRVMPWDYAAAWLILSEAGGRLSDRSGKILDCSRPTMLVGANTCENHERLLKIIDRYTLENYYEYK